MPFATVTSWSQDAPATARTRSVSASVKIENDATLRKGDLVAGADGLMVAGHAADRRGASLNFSPASNRCARACRSWPPNNPADIEGLRSIESERRPYLFA